MVRTPRPPPVLCCDNLKYYQTKNNLVEKLLIRPRVIICKQPLKCDESYELLLLVKNCGLKSRRLIYYTDTEDMKLKFPGDTLERYLGADEERHITICLNPKSMHDINRRRHILIESEHPNICFEVPIIILHKGCEPTCSPLVEFPSSIPTTKSCYEFIVYNPLPDPIGVAIKSFNNNLTVEQSEKNAPKRNYITVLLTLNVLNLKAYKDTLRVKLDRSFIELMLRHEPASALMYCSVSQLEYGRLKYGTSTTQQFSLCNQSDKPAPFIIHFDCEAKSTGYEDSVDEDASSAASQPSSMGSFELAMAQEFDGEEAQVQAKSKPAEVEIAQDPYIDGYKHFIIENMKGTIPPFSSIKISVTFRPSFDVQFDDKANPPFKVRAKIIAKVMDGEKTLWRTVLVKGFISGPSIEFAPDMLDLRAVYVGEEHCAEITVTNIDGHVPATVFLENYVEKTDASIIVRPEEGFVLKPGEAGTFHITFFAIMVGRFAVKLQFKVKNGKLYKVFVSGISYPVGLRLFPEVIELGNIPIAVPQRRFLLVLNPLQVPITVQFEATENGDEVPLTLNISDVNALLPINVKDPVYQLLQANEPDDITEYPPVELVSKESSLQSFRSVSDVSSTSTVFENDVLDKIPEFAKDLVATLKKKGNLFNKTEVEKRVLLDALDPLLHTKYFDAFTTNNNYAFMDWNTLPSDPKELYCDTEVSYLGPGANRTVTVLLIPNQLGYHKRYLNIRICPVCKYEDDEKKVLVDTSLMTTKVWIEYNCRLPEIEFEDTFNFTEQAVYAGEEYYFEMDFRNFSMVGGFLHYDLIPDSEGGFMWFSDDIWKFHIGPQEEVTANCAVMFRKKGDIRLVGLLKILGDPNGVPFYIMANVRPARVRVRPASLSVRQGVMEATTHYFYVENLTPTSTWIIFSLKNERHQQINPHGTILNPYGQGMYVALHTMYTDPDVYKNMLHLELPHGNSIDVPITFNIEGMPIYFEPNIREGFDTGILFTNTKEDYDANRPKYIFPIKVINKGERVYKLNIQKLKNSVGKCAADIIKGRINIDPNKNILIDPKSSMYIFLTADAYEETELHNEFRLTIYDVLNKKRFQTVLFTITAKFILCELHWCRKEIVINYNRTHKFKEHIKLELVHLINVANVSVETVTLQIAGPFRMKQLFEHHFSKELEFSMSGLERKELTIALVKSAIKDEFCTTIRGRIHCTANNRVQRSLPIRVNIFQPFVKISEPDLVLFTMNFETDGSVELENKGCLKADYKWKKIQEQKIFIEDWDDARDFASEILSDIFRRLQLPTEPDEKSLSLLDGNLTLIYQHYRCQMKRLEDPICVLDIIDEIINNLDLEHKRYKLTFPDDDDMDGSGHHTPCSENGPRPTSECAVEDTIDKILGNLKLEDSYEISEPSEEDCLKDRTIYFYEKSGSLEQNEKVECAIHLPAVRKGYIVTATFHLDVVGCPAPHIFNITLVNLQRTIEIIKDNIYLGMKPWYESYKAKPKIKNVTPFPVKIKLSNKPFKRSCEKPNRLCDGYVNIAEKFIALSAHGQRVAPMEGIMGFSDEFIRDIHLNINDSDDMNIRLRGQGIMPILSVMDKMERLEQSQAEIVDEYKLLQRIYHFDVFKSLTEEDEELPTNEERPNKTYDLDEDNDHLSQVSIISASTTKTQLKELRFFYMMKSWVMVNHNEVPNALVLEQLIETEKFLVSACTDPETAGLLNKVYQDYLKFLRNYDKDMPINLKHFTVQPLPFGSLGVKLDMGKIAMNQYRRFEVNLQFFGPGKLIAAARTVVTIPGLIVHFEVSEKDSVGKEFIFYRDKPKAPDYFEKRYRNMYERELDLETDPKLNHAHSFDLSSFEKHLREISLKDRKAVQNYYNSLNKSVYQSHKHHFVLCKIFTNCKHNFSGTHLKVVVLVRPTPKFYKVGQLLVDYLFIDLHMGPTLPILLHGQVKNG